MPSRIRRWSIKGNIFFRVVTFMTSVVYFVLIFLKRVVFDRNSLPFNYQVHINLGAGETEVASEASFLLNDMKWHSVNLTRRGSQLTILVDNHLTK